MHDIIVLLENQREVEHLTYFIHQDKFNIIHLKLSAITINKKFKFKDESACLSKIVDILLDLKKLEKWAKRRAEKEK